jgi:hypothetical protein
MVLLCAVAAVCQRESPANVPAPQVLATNTSWGTFHVTVTPRPNPIPLNQLFALSIAVSHVQDHDKPAADTTVAVDARMPEHNHGMNLQPQVSADGGGRFRADGLLFHMPGRWELYVDVTRGTEMERATFDVNLE